MWKQCSDYPDYEVSHLGEVRRMSTGRILKEREGEGGYRMVTLLLDGRRRVPVYVHLLVAGPRPPGAICVHVDGDLSNNAEDNLRWVFSRKGYRSPRPGDSGARAIRRRYSDGEPAAAIAADYGITAKAVRDISSRGGVRGAAAVSPVLFG